MTARQSITQIAGGQLTVRELLIGYLENIDSLEDRVGAWAYFHLI